MALFGSKTKKAEKVAVKTVAVKEVKVSTAPMNFDIIIRPRITEKSGMMNEALNVYTFEVSKNATKYTVAQAVKGLYKVTPLKVRIVSLPRKNVFVRGTKGKQSAIKKAMVFLKKGDKIDIA